MEKIEVGLTIIDRAATCRERPSLQFEAARLASDGLHEFQCSAPRTRQREKSRKAKTCLTYLGEWIAQEQAARTQAAVPSPESGDWTNLGQITLLYANEYLSWQNRFRLFRVNDTDPTSDWYMILRDPESTPNFHTCQTFGACGWYTNKRDFQISIGPSLAADPNVTFLDWSPQQEIKSGSGSLSLGFSLGSVVPVARSRVLIYVALGKMRT